MSTTNAPWADGPIEILDLAAELRGRDSDSSRRLAFLIIDNAVEQMLKSYLALPKRVTGIDLSRKQQREATADFPSLLDAFEEHASEALQGVDFSAVEYFHRIRNGLTTKDLDSLSRRRSLISILKSRFSSPRISLDTIQRSLLCDMAFPGLMSYAWDAS